MCIFVENLANRVGMEEGERDKGGLSSGNVYL